LFCLLIAQAEKLFRRRRERGAGEEETAQGPLRVVQGETRAALVPLDTAGV